MGLASEMLRQVRERHGLTQEELATRANISRSTISRIECNRVSPSVEMLGELLFLMGEDLVLEAKARKPKIDRKQLEIRLAMTPEERVEAGLAEAAKVIGESKR